MRTITRSNWYDSAKPLNQKNEILDVKRMTKFEAPKIMHNHLHNVLPPVFDNYFNKVVNTHNQCTRFANVSTDLGVPLFKTKRTQQSIKYAGVKLWNSIPSELRDLSFKQFNKEYKNLLLKS